MCFRISYQPNHRFTLCPLPITHWNINKLGRSIQNEFIYLWAVTLPNPKQAHFTRHLAFINSSHWISTAWSAFLFPSFSGSIFHENWGNWFGYDNMDAYLLLFILNASLNVPFNRKLDLNHLERNFGPNKFDAIYYPSLASWDIWIY